MKETPSRPPLDPDRLLTADEAGALLGIGRSLLWSLAARGELPSLHLGRLRRFRRSALLAWIEARERREVRP